MNDERARGSFADWLDGDAEILRESESVYLSMDDLPPADAPVVKRPPGRSLKTPGRALYVLLVAVVCVLLGAQLTLSSAMLPPFGESGTPVDNVVTERYVESAIADTGALNAVTGMILDFRAFDTLGEAIVLFTALMFVSLVMREPAHTAGALARPSGDRLLRRAVRLLAPFITLYGIYVVLNGHLSPGGGFSGGAVLGSALILCCAAFGERRVSGVLRPERVRLVMCAALLLYAVVKGAVFFAGANGIKLDLGAGTPGSILSGGLILPLNIGVGVVVCSVFYTLYTFFSEDD